MTRSGCALRDIQDNDIPSYGKRTVDVEFVGEEQQNLRSRLRMDVSDVGKNVAAMGRLLRAGFDMHFTEGGHNCWMAKDNQTTTIYQDSPDSEAPLYFMRLRVLPVPDEGEERRR